MEHSLSLTLLTQKLAVCRLAPDAPMPELKGIAPMWSVTRTRDELSIILPEDAADPAWDQVEKGWRCLRVEGPLDFALVGIIADLAATLAVAKVSIFALSTYDTDHVLLKNDVVEHAIEALTNAGHRISRES